jgi:hypothetical protein
LNPQDLLDLKRKKKNELIAMGRLVKDTLQSEGWVKVGEPLLNKMIMDIMGGFRDGEWSMGVLNKCKKDETISYYIGYKQALIDYHNRLNAYVKNIKFEEESLKIMDEDLKEKYTIPMLEEY